MPFLQLLVKLTTYLSFYALARDIGVVVKALQRVVQCKTVSTKCRNVLIVGVLEMTENETFLFFIKT